MTEDDTFNKLKKADWETVYNVFKNLDFTVDEAMTAIELKEFYIQLKRLGWTPKEFISKMLSEIY